MDVNWQDPGVVSLHERLAACIQEEYEDSLTSTRRLADADSFGRRTAVEILNRALRVDVAGSNEWTVAFAADPPPSGTAGCVTCGAKEGDLHDTSYCHRRGVQRKHGAKVEL